MFLLQWVSHDERVVSVAEDNMPNKDQTEEVMKLLVVAQGTKTCLRCDLSDLDASQFKGEVQALIVSLRARLDD